MPTLNAPIGVSPQIPTFARRITVLFCIISLIMLPLQQAMGFSATMEYYHYNHQGSLLEVYDGVTNKRLLSQAWSPWGERQVLHTTVGDSRSHAASLLAKELPIRIGYTGHKALLSTGLTFAGDTRLYDARLKRFLNSDDRTTGGIKGQNRYSYAYNNPMSYIDPDGHVPEAVDAIINIGGGANNDRRIGIHQRSWMYGGAIAIGTMYTGVNGAFKLAKDSAREVGNYFREKPSRAVALASLSAAVDVGVNGFIHNSVPLSLAVHPLLVLSFGLKFPSMAIHPDSSNCAYFIDCLMSMLSTGAAFAGNYLSSGLPADFTSTTANNLLASLYPLAFFTTAAYSTYHMTQERNNNFSKQLMGVALTLPLVYLSGIALWQLSTISSSPSNPTIPRLP